MEETKSVRVLCRNLISHHEASLQWLIGSLFFPKFTIISTFRCLHLLSSDPDFSKEANDIRSLLIRGFHVIGALIIGENADLEEIAKRAINAARKLRETLYGDENSRDFDLIAGVCGSSGSDVNFFASKSGDVESVRAVESVVYEKEPDKFVWERGCLIRCEISIKLPVYVPANAEQSEAVERYDRANEALIAKLKDPQLTYIVEILKKSSENVPRPVIIRGSDLDFKTDLSNVEILTDGKSLCCSYFCSESSRGSSVIDAEILFR